MARIISKYELIRRITDIAVPAAASFGLDVWGVEILTAGRPVARIFVDAPEGGRKPRNFASGSQDDAVARTGDSSEVMDGCEVTDSSEAMDSDAHDQSMPLDPSVAQDVSGFSQGVAGIAQGVSVDECARISRMVGLAIEVDEMFADPWMLEVSSPGLERTFYRLEQMSPYIGREVEAALWDPHPLFEGRKKFRGTLLAVNDGQFTLRADKLPSPERSGAEPAEQNGSAVQEAEVSLVWSATRKVRLIHTFPDTSKPNPGKKSGKGGGTNA